MISSRWSSHFFELTTMTVSLIFDLQNLGTQNQLDDDSYLFYNIFRISRFFVLPDSWFGIPIKVLGLRSGIFRNIEDSGLRYSSQLMLLFISLSTEPVKQLHETLASCKEKWPSIRTHVQKLQYLSKNIVYINNSRKIFLFTFLAFLFDINSQVSFMML